MSDERDDTARSGPGDRAIQPRRQTAGALMTSTAMGSTAAYAAFRRWLEAEETAAALATRPDDDPDYDAAVAASSAAARVLAAAPVITGRDLALKLYVLAHVENPPSRDVPHPCALATLPPEPSADDTEDEALRKAIARDALALWPALARLARGDAGAFYETTDSSSTAGDTSDAGLLTAWESYAAGWRAIDALSAAGRDRDDDPERIAAYAQMGAAHNVLLNTPWHTPAGLAAKLRRALMTTEPSGDVDHAIIYGTPVPVDQLGRVADADRFIATMLQHAEALATATAVPAQSRHPDTTLLEAFARLLVVMEEEDSPEMAAEERALYQIITSTPAHTLASVLVKLEWLTNCAWGFGEEEPEMVAVLRTLEEAAGSMGHPIAKTIRRSVQNTQSLARMLNDAQREASENADAAARDADERAVLDAMRGIDKAPRSAFVKAITAFHQGQSAAALADMLEVVTRLMQAETKRIPAAMASARAAIADLHALIGEQPDQPQDADPFGAAVAEFEQAAPSVLPAVPSAVMIEAGAAAAGIDPTAVRALYAAMVQAHQQERAA